MNKDKQFSKLNNKDKKNKKIQIKIEGVIDAENSIKPSFFKTLCKCLCHLCIWLFATITVLLIGLFIFLSLICKGPSTYIRNLFVSSCIESESGTGKMLAKIFFTNDEVTNIVSQNKIIANPEITDTSLINSTSNITFDKEKIKDISIDSIESDIIDPDGDGIETIEIDGATYHGTLMIVYNPSRINLGISDKLSTNGGDTLIDLINKYDAVAGINASDSNDKTSPDSNMNQQKIIISDGNLLMGNMNISNSICGFTNDNIFVVGTMTAEQALEMGINDAISCAPALITNGKPAKTYGCGSGLNSRTAIGQRADGTILLLTIKGMQSDSIGASYSDLIKIMSDYGAVNAANLDGGMSSSMFYDGNQIINNSHLNQTHKIFTAFLVERGCEDGQ